MTRAVFLDRDGVLNDAVLRDGTPHPPADAASMTIVAGAADALLRLRATGARKRYGFHRGVFQRGDCVLRKRDRRPGGRYPLV